MGKRKVKQIFNGEIGRLEGVKVLTSNDIKTAITELKKENQSVATYGNYILVSNWTYKLFNDTPEWLRNFEDRIHGNK